MGLSGKADFEDFVCMHHSPKEILDKFQIYADKHYLVPLKIESEKDLVAYYPYLIASMNKDKDSGKIYLSSESYIEHEEKEHIGWKLDALKKYYRKCKRKKEPFDKNAALKKIIWLDENPRLYEIELVNRVANFGEKATINDLHDDTHDQMRKKWYNMMVKAGWSETQSLIWVYGWERYLDGIEGKG